MIRPDHLLTDVIRPTLAAIGLQSLAAEQLMLGTAVAESTIAGMTCLHQLGGGPALSPWQIEPATHEDIWLNWLAHRPQLRGLVELLLPPLYQRSGTAPCPAPRVLCGHLPYACAIARIVYLRRPEPLPAAGDWRAIAGYWKANYNTASGAGTPEHFLAQIGRHAIPDLWSTTRRTA